MTRLDLQDKLLAIWKSILEIEDINVNDDFFSLGGSSLQAVFLIWTIETELKVKIPSAVFFNNCTIDGQVEAIIKKPVFTSLVPIRITEGGKPFFMIHGSSGNILFCKKMVKYLPASISFFGLQAKEFCDWSENRITNIASNYVKEICQQDAKGPYFIAGRCLGGIIALEIARQLRSKGKEIGMLALVDSMGPGYAKIKPSKLKEDDSAVSSKEDSNRIVVRAKKHMRKMLKLNPIDAYRYFRRRYSGIMKMKVKRRLSKFSYLLNKKTGFPIPRFFRDITLDLLEACHGNKNFREVREDIILLKSTDGYHDPIIEWQKKVHGSIHLSYIPGNHDSIWEEPNIQILTEELNKHIISDNLSSSEYESL